MDSHKPHSEEVARPEPNGDVLGLAGVAGARRIRVLHVITRLIIGGAQENTLLTVTRLDRGRFDITLASGPSAGPEGSLEDRIPKDITFKRIPELIRNPHPLKDIVAFNRLYALMKDGHYDVVHTHTTKAGILGRIAARLAGVPVVVHTPHGHAFHDYLGAFGSWSLKAIERSLTPWTNRIVCLTETERRDYLRSCIAPPEKLEIVHSGVDIPRFRQARMASGETRQALGLPRQGPLIGCVARLVPVKGVHYLLHAVPSIRASVPNAAVVFVGDGPMRSELERRANDMGLNGAVVFLGLRRDVAEILHSCALIVVPSLNEGMGRAAVEALAAGRPVIASRIGGLQDVVIDGVTGFLVPPADPDALARAIIRCLADPSSMVPMVQRAQQEAVRYDIGPMVRKIDRLYTRLLSR